MHIVTLSIVIIPKRFAVTFRCLSDNSHRIVLTLILIYPRHHRVKLPRLKIKQYLSGIVMKKLLSLAAIAVLSACGQAPSENTSNNTQAESPAVVEKAQSESERLNAWFETKYEEQLLRSPMTLTRLGRKERYDEFDDYTEAAGEAQLKWQAQSVEELKSQFDYDKLTEDAKISYDIWVYQYEAAKAQQPYQRRTYVFTQMLGAHANLPNFLINFHRVDDASDMDAYIKRIGGLSTAISQLLERAKIHANEGVRPPYFAYEGIIEQSSNILRGNPFEESVDDSPLFADAKKEIKGLLEADKIDSVQARTLEEQAKNALLEHLKPSYENLITWFTQDFANVPKQATGVGALPNGEAYYNAALLARTTTNLTANEIHDIGVSEVKRILGLMDGIRQTVEFKGSLQEFFAYIKSDVKNEQFYFPDTDEGRQGYLDDSAAYLDYIKGKLPEYFGLLPKADLVVKRVEAFRERPGAAQHYNAGTPDGSRPGVYYAHLSDMTSMPKNEMEAIAYHEGNPGHHMQISIAQELEGVPKFRTQAFFNSYIEGWALYSELLAKEMGAYNNPYSDFGRLVTEMWRAIRLVVDTGIHAKGWTEEQAIAYFKENSPIAEGQILSEVRRYFVWPGQATSYKIGMLKILELRAKAQQELGDKFDIRGFHDTILGGGSVPLDVLERMVNNWIEKNKA
jgi:uncharacterized protein (DUF885 family)